MHNTIGPIIFDLHAQEVSQEEKDILAHPLIGGVILFARNYESPEQISRLTSSLRKIKKSPLLICVDQEGGRVQRFQNGFTRIPAMGSVGEIFNESKERGLMLANACGFIMAAELLQVGVDLSFAPVLDLHKEDNPAINDRAFSANADDVIQLAGAFIQGMRAAGMAACGKHFPGHGSVKIDSHVALPTDTRTFDEIFLDDLQPFSRISLDAIMASHILFPNVDANPVGFSEFWLRKVLREQLTFSGIIFSDDLSMQGAVVFGDCVARSQTALQAGCDFILICNNRADVIKTLDQLPKVTNGLSIEKFEKIKGKFSASSVGKNLHVLQAKHTILKKFMREKCKL